MLSAKLGRGVGCYKNKARKMYAKREMPSMPERERERE